MNWVLIIILHGWGAGIGSTGNAVATVEFSSRDKCHDAAEEIVTAERLAVSPSGKPIVICVER